MFRARARLLSGYFAPIAWYADTILIPNTMQKMIPANAVTIIAPPPAAITDSLRSFSLLLILEPFS